MRKSVMVFNLVLVGWGVAMITAAAGNMKTTLSAGVTVTDGNTETVQANATLVSQGEREGLGSVRAGIKANYGESKVDGDRDTTIDNARAFANLKKTISPRTFVSLDLSVGYDTVADVDYRAIAAPGLGVYVVRNDATSVFFEAGPAYVWEQVDGVSDDYFAVRLAERLEHSLSETATLWQSIEYVPKADDFDDYLLTSEVGIEAAMTARMNLRLVLRNTYDSTPAADLERNDLTFIAGVSLTL